MKMMSWAKVRTFAVFYENEKSNFFGNFVFLEEEDLDGEEEEVSLRSKLELIFQNIARTKCS